MSPPETPEAKRPSPETPEKKRASGLVLVGTALIIITALAAFGLARVRSSHAQVDAVQRSAEVSAGPVVRSVAVTLSPTIRSIVLLGEARPYASVTLYAKLSGYLKRITVDRGDRVRAGDLVAEIESPETERAYMGAKADHDNKASISNRVEQLLARKFVSPQEAEQARADAAVSAERLQALQEERAYEVLKAPFDGTVTARYADPGALMQNAASSQTSALPVVTISQTDRLRVFIYLDQHDAAALRPGAPATISLTEGTGETISATVTRATGEIDPRTRKLLAEIDLANPAGHIVPGSFVRVELRLPSPAYPRIPVEALVVKQNRTYVAVLAADSTMHLHAVSVVDNDGQTVTVTGDVAAGQQVVLNVGDAIADGSRVRPVSAPAARAGGPAPK
jgi:membrane fusion protein (multidrug efflux system)